MYHVGIGYLQPVQWPSTLGPVAGAPPDYRYDALPDNTGKNQYQIVGVNILLEDTIPSAVLTVNVSATPNVTLYWIPVPGAVQYKILRNSLRIATVGSTGAKDSVYTNFMSYKDAGASTNAYTPVAFMCQHLLPFQTTSVESWSPPSQA